MDISKPLTKLPSEIAHLKRFSENARTSSISATILNDAVRQALKYLEGRYKQLFPKDKNKKYTDERIGEAVFVYQVEEKQLTEYLKCSWHGVSRILKTSAENLEQLLASKSNATLLSAEADYFETLVSDVIYFLDYAETLKNAANHNGYGFGKRGVIFSLEAYCASVDHLKCRMSKNTFASFIRQPAAVFFIRQAIELRIKNALGIHQIVDLNYNPLMITSERYVEFAFSRKEIDVPIDKSILKKIYHWTNYFIHAGMLPEVWKIGFAQRLLEKLFKSADGPRKSWHLFGAIKIDRSYYEGELEPDFKKFICDGKKQTDFLSKMRRLFSRKSRMKLLPQNIILERNDPEALLV